MATVLVPWRGGDPHREAAWRWVRERWRNLPHPVVRCWSQSGPWRKGEVIRDFSRQVDDEILILADADVWCDGIEAAIEAVEAGAGWAAPHQKVHRLTERATDYLLRGCCEPLALDTIEDPYNGIPGGGIVVVRRKTLLEVPFDPRFNGWGGIDTSWRDAMLTLIGAPRRGRDPLFHLYHPPQPRRTRKVGSRENDLLRRRYVRATGRRKQMRALLAEIDLEVNRGEEKDQQAVHPEGDQAPGPASR